MSMQHGGHYAQVNGANAVDAQIQRQRLLAQLNESTWQRIGKVLLFIYIRSQLIHPSRKS